MKEKDYCAWGDNLVEMAILIHKFNTISIRIVFKTHM